MEVQKITAEVAKRLTRDNLLSKHNILKEIHFSSIVDDIDRKIEENIKSGCPILFIDVQNDSPSWYLLGELRKEYESRGFYFKSHDQLDNPNFIIQESNDYKPYNNTIIIKWI